jgi:hypothetical protein
MTDPLTDAVRRIKKLQEDVERLKAGQDEEGESRLLFSAQETAIAAEVIEVVSSDIPESETAAVDDVLAIVSADIAQSETAVAADQQGGIVSADIAQAETAIADDQQEDIRARALDTLGSYNEVGYNTSTYNK